MVKKSHMGCLFSIILIQCLYDLHLGYFRMTYDLKQRKKAILLAESGVSLRSVARQFMLSPTTVINWYKTYKTTGTISLPPPRKRTKKLEAHRDYVIEQLKLNPEITLFEFKDKLYEEKGIEISHNTISLYLRSLGYSYKKNTKSYRKS